MACPHFSQPSTGSLYCGKSGCFQSEYHANQYCRSDSYWRECPNYKGSSSCFLTTACVHHAGLPDDCHELTGMRNFRDDYLLSLPNGQAMFDEYYRLAPAIVKAIECDEKQADILTDILGKVRDCVHFVDSGHNEAAFDIYIGMFNELKNKFITC